MIHYRFFTLTLALPLPLLRLGLPHNCGQSEKLLNKRKEDCHGISKKNL